MIHVCRLTAKNRDRLQNPTLGDQVWATFLPLYINQETATDFGNKLTRSQRQAEQRMAPYVCMQICTDRQRQEVNIIPQDPSTG